MKFVKNVSPINQKGAYYVPIASTQNIYDVIGSEENNIGRYVLLVPKLYTLTIKCSLVRKTNLLMSYKSTIKY